MTRVEGTKIVDSVLVYCGQASDRKYKFRQVLTFWGKARPLCPLACALQFLDEAVGL
jgi:hypothetical protein